MSLKPESIKVACYNTLAECWINPCKPMFVGCWDKRKVELVNRIDNMKADVICLQEVDRFNDLAHLLYKRGYIGYRVNDRDVAIFYKSDRFKVLKTESLFYQDGFYRSALMLKLQSANGTPFNVISTHVTWKPEFDVKEMKELQQFVSQQKGDPTIVCGDLNATPDWAPIQNLCKDGFQDTLGNSTKKTYIDQGRRLDYILTSKGIHTLAADVDGETKKLSTADEPSDHLPVISELMIPSGLKTLNTRTPKTIAHNLIEALNEGMKSQEHTQEYYNTVAPLFHLLLDAVEKDASENFLDALLLKLDSPIIKGDRPVLYSAIRRYEHERLQEIISIIHKGQTQEAISQFSKLSEQLRQQVYFSVYEIEKKNGRTISHPKFGEVAFHNLDNVNVSNEIRVKAIERCLLREVHILLKANKENEAMPLFATLSAEPIRNAIYGETYASAQKRALKIEHSDFGKVAFHRLEKCDVPSDLRIEAIENYISKTSV